MSRGATAAVVGIGATPPGRRSPASEHALATAAVVRALADAGLGIEDVDGVVRCDRDAAWEYDLPGVLRLRGLPYYGAVPFGAGGAPALLGLAKMAVEEGLASVVVGWHARDGMARAGEVDPDVDFVRPLGVPGRVEAAAVLLRWWLARHGLRPPRLPSPGARLGGRAAAALADPVRRGDVVRPVAGGVAFVVAAAGSGSRRRPPVLIRAVAQAAIPDATRHLHESLGPARERPLERARRALWRASGCRPADVGAAFVHADPRSLALVAAVDWGLDPRAALARRPRPALNPHAGQPGAGALDGMAEVAAAVRAVRRGTRVVLVAGSPLEPTSAAVLSMASP